MEIIADSTSCGVGGRLTSLTTFCILFCMKAILHEAEVVMRRGKPVSVILPIKDFEELLERVEDAEDVAWLKRARRKPIQYRPIEDYLAACRK
jgi:hypothetical protein